LARYPSLFLGKTPKNAPIRQRLDYVDAHRWLQRMSVESELLTREFDQFKTNRR
jgi:hypothetical protein